MKLLGLVCFVSAFVARGDQEEHQQQAVPSPSPPSSPPTQQEKCEDCTPLQHALANAKATVQDSIQLLEIERREVQDLKELLEDKDAQLKKGQLRDNEVDDLKHKLEEKDGQLKKEKTKNDSLQGAVKELEDSAAEASLGVTTYLYSSAMSIGSFYRDVGLHLLDCCWALLPAGLKSTLQPNLEKLEASKETYLKKASEYYTLHLKGPVEVAKQSVTPVLMKAYFSAMQAWRWLSNTMIFPKVDRFLLAYPEHKTFLPKESADLFIALLALSVVFYVAIWLPFRIVLCCSFYMLTCGCCRRRSCKSSNRRSSRSGRKASQSKSTSPVRPGGYASGGTDYTYTSSTTAASHGGGGAVKQRRQK